jgi:glycolate oxidase iron-sulfur subunit
MIPQSEVFELPDNEVCCGAAGSFFLTQPTLAKDLGGDKISHIKSTKPDIVATTNTGCALQLRTQIRQARLRTRVLHPVELLNQQLIAPGFQA